MQDNSSAPSHNAAHRVADAAHGAASGIKKRPAAVSTPTRVTSSDRARDPGDAAGSDYCPEQHDVYGWCCGCGNCRQHCLCVGALVDARPSKRSTLSLLQLEVEPTTEPSLVASKGAPSAVSAVWDAPPLGTISDTNEDGSDSDGGEPARSRLPGALHQPAQARRRPTPPARSTSNPLLRAARELKLDDNIRRAAQNSNKSRRAADIPALQERTLQSLVQCVMAILLRLFALWSPNDSAGLYSVVRMRLDKHFGVEQENSVSADAEVCAAAATVLHALPKRSREALAIKAVLGGAGKKYLVAALSEASALQEARNEGGDDSESGGDDSDGDDRADESVSKRAAVTKWTYLRTRVHFRRMAVGQTLAHVPGSRKRTTDDAVQGVIDFLYRANNTSTLSWGCTRLKIDGREEVIQARNRQRSLSRLWLAYKTEVGLALPPVPRTARVQRTSFFEIASAVTARDLKVRIVDSAGAT